LSVIQVDITDYLSNELSVIQVDITDYLSNELRVIQVAITDYRTNELSVIRLAITDYLRLLSPFRLCLVYYMTLSSMLYQHFLKCSFSYMVD